MKSMPRRTARHCYTKRHRSPIPVQILTLEMSIDRFPKEAVSQLADAIGSASSLPVFAAASQFMLVGSSVVKLLGGIVDCVFDGKPFFTGSHPIRFGIPPYTNNTADQIVLVMDGGESEFVDCQILPNGTLAFPPSGEPYRGPKPYVSITLDGRERPELKDFQATEASVELLDRFFGADSAGDSQTAELLTAVKLLNDSKMRREVDRVQSEMNDLDPGSSEYLARQEIRDAFI